jgi:hypothetical protein
MDDEKWGEYLDQMMGRMVSGAPSEERNAFRAGFRVGLNFGKAALAMHMGHERLARLLVNSSEMARYVDAYRGYVNGEEKKEVEE